MLMRSLSFHYSSYADKIDHESTTGLIGIASHSNWNRIRKKPISMYANIPRTIADRYTWYASDRMFMRGNG